MALTTYKNAGKFPHGLLEADFDDRKKYFANCLVHHRNLDKAVETAMSYIESWEPESLIIVCGPSGVGKKEFIREITRKLVEAEEGNPNKVSGCIPVVNVEARAPEERSFKFSSLFFDTLRIMHTPMLDKRINSDYQEILRKALCYSHVKAYIINEAQHMCRVATAKKANWSLDVIKSLTSHENTAIEGNSETAIVLVGTYDLLNILDGSINFADQIHERVHIIDFARYNQKDEKDMYHFGVAAKKLLYHIPFEEIDEKFVDRNWKYLYTYSLGRIGTLKRWFIRAYAYAIQQEAKFLTKEHLDKTRNSGNQIKVELKAIEEGESNIAQIRSDGDLEDLIKFYDEDKNMDTKKTPAKRNTRKPFERNPKRDDANKGLVNVVTPIGGESVS